MATLCASSSSTSSALLFASSSSSSSSNSKPYFASVKRTPFLGFTLATSKPTLATSSCSRAQIQIRCQDLSVVPQEQRWMFDDSEIGGPDIWNKTWYPKASDHVNTDKQWYVVDATDKILGRLASTIAYYIRGKNLATYTPSVDMGSFVVVVIPL